LLKDARRILTADQGRDASQVENATARKDSLTATQIGTEMILTGASQQTGHAAEAVNLAVANHAMIISTATSNAATVNASKDGIAATVTGKADANLKSVARSASLMHLVPLPDVLSGDLLWLTSAALRANPGCNQWVKSG